MNVTIVSPIFNEQDGIKNFLEKVRHVVRPYIDRGEWVVRFLLVDDGSLDHSLAVIKDLAAGSSDIEYIALVRNSGHQAALCAGLVKIDDLCDIVITMDSDLEHPPELIPTLIGAYLSSKSPIVNSRRKRDVRLPLGKKILSSVFYKMVRLTTGVYIENGAADFRLYDADIVRQIRGHLGSSASLRLLSSYIVPSAPYVDYRQNVIPGRRSRFTFRKNLSLALDSLVSFSELPGIAMAILSLFGITLGGMFALFSVLAYFAGRTVPGWASIVGIIIIFSSLNLGCLAMLFMYLSRHLFRARLPNYIIRRRE